jgi:hypothetical protein
LRGRPHVGLQSLRLSHRGHRRRGRRDRSDIDLSEWLGGNPADVLATNFGKPAALFKKFPRKDVFITDGNGSGK